MWAIIWERCSCHPFEDTNRQKMRRGDTCTKTASDNSSESYVSFDVFGFTCHRNGNVVRNLNVQTLMQEFRSFCDAEVQEITAFRLQIGLMSFCHCRCIDGRSIALHPCVEIVFSPWYSQMNSKQRNSFSTSSNSKWSELKPSKSQAVLRETVPVRDNHT